MSQNIQAQISGTDPDLVKSLTKRGTLGILSVIVFFYCILEVFILAIMTSIAAANIKKIPGYDGSKQLQESYKAFVGITVFLWIVVGLLIFAIFTGFIFLGLGLAAIPYVNMIGVGLNLIVNFIILGYSIVTLNKVNSFIPDSCTSDSTSDECTQYNTIKNTLIGMIVLVIITVLFTVPVTVFNVYKYYKSGGIVSDVQTAVQVAPLLL